MDKALIFTKDVGVDNSTTQTELWRTNFGCVPPQRCVRVTIYGHITNNTGSNPNIQFYLKLNGTQLLVMEKAAPTGGESYKLVYTLFFSGSEFQEMSGELLVDGIVPDVFKGEYSVDTSRDSELAFYVALSTATTNLAVHRTFITVENLI